MTKDIENINRKFKWGFFKEVAIYSFWIFLNAIMDRVYWSTGQFVLGMVKGAASVAVYAVAITLQSYFMSFSTSISGVFLPRVTGMISHGCSDREVSDLFIRTGRIQFIVMAFVLTGFVVFGNDVLFDFTYRGNSNVTRTRNLAYKLQELLNEQNPNYSVRELKKIKLYLK